MVLGYSTMLFRFIWLILVSVSVQEEETENFCLNKQMAVDNEELARKHSDDEIIVKLVALRAGLCDLIEKGIVDLDFAIHLFNAEHSKGVYKRIEEEQTGNRGSGA